MYKNHISIIVSAECILLDEFKGLMDIIAYADAHSENRFSIYLVGEEDKFSETSRNAVHKFLDHLQLKDETGNQKIVFELSRFKDVLIFIEDGRELWIYDRIKKGIASKWRNMRYM